MAVLSRYIVIPAGIAEELSPFDNGGTVGLPVVERAASRYGKQ